MTNEKWEDLVEMTKKNFKTVKVSSEDLIHTTEEGQKKQGTQDILEFTGPSGTYKLVRENRPVILEKKEHYSHRPGDTSRTEYKVSDTEFSHRLRVYKENDNFDWEEVDAANFGI